MPSPPCRNCLQVCLSLNVRLRTINGGQASPDISSAMPMEQPECRGLGFTERGIFCSLQAIRGLWAGGLCLLAGRLLHADRTVVHAWGVPRTFARVRIVIPMLGFGGWTFFKGLARPPGNVSAYLMAALPHLLATCPLDCLWHLDWFHAH